MRVSLRGLGGQNTLVLLNGRRWRRRSAMCRTATASYLDLDPVRGVERVEVLKDGASAIYGTDAVAGVINFILRQNFPGFEVTATTAHQQRRRRRQVEGHRHRPAGAT